LYNKFESYILYEGKVCEYYFDYTVASIIWNIDCTVASICSCWWI